MSISTQPQRLATSEMGLGPAKSQAAPRGEAAPRSPFGQDTVSISREAYQVAEATPQLHLNTPAAIQAAQANPGSWQRYKHSYNGHPGSVRSVNGQLEWDK
jgi:hypothetical protein